MSIASEIARIKEARIKMSAAAAALTFEKLTDFETYDIVSSNASGDTLETEFLCIGGKETVLTLKFNDVESCNKFKNDDFTYINIYSGNNDDNILAHYSTSGDSMNMRAVTSNSVDTVTLRYIITVPSDVMFTTIFIYQEAVDDMPLTVTFSEPIRFRATDKIDQLAEALDLVAFHQFESITDNGALKKGFYRDCEINVPVTCDHVQTTATVDLDTGNVVFKNMNGETLETSVYDANDIENDKYVVNEVYVTNIPDTTALTNRVSELESELTNIETELQGL